LISVDVTLAVRAVDGMAKRYPEIKRRIDNAVEDTTREGAQLIMRDHNQLTYAEKHVISGAYARGSRMDVQKRGQEIKATITNTQEYDIHLETRYKLYERVVRAAEKKIQRLLQSKIARLFR